MERTRTRRRESEPLTHLRQIRTRVPASVLSPPTGGCRMCLPSESGLIEVALESHSHRRRTRGDGKRREKEGGWRVTVFWNGTRTCVGCPKDVANRGGEGSHCTWTALHENVVGQTGRGSRKREPYRAIIAHRCGVARARETVSGRGPQDTGVHGAVFQQASFGRGSEAHGLTAAPLRNLASDFLLFW